MSKRDNIGGVICFGPELFAFVIMEGVCLLADRQTRREVSPEVYNALVDSIDWTGWVLSAEDKTTIGTC